MATRLQVQLDILGRNLAKGAFDQAIKRLDKVNELANNIAAKGRKGSRGWSAGFLQFGASASLAAENFDRMGRTAVAALANPLKRAVAFEKAMLEVKGATEASAAQFKMLNDEAKRLGAETLFSNLDVAKTQKVLAHAGVTPELIKQIMPSVLDLGVVGDPEKISLDRVADLTTGIMQQFHMKPEEMLDAVNILSVVRIKTKQELEDLANAMKYAGQVANHANIPLEKVGIIMGDLASGGLKADMAGTGFRRIVQRILAHPVDDMTKVLKKVGPETKKGIETGDLSNIDAVMLELSEAVRKMGPEMGNKFLQDLFGDRALTAAMTNFSARGTQMSLQLRDAMANRDGFARKYASTIENSSYGRLEELEGKWDTALTNLGTKLLPTLVKVVEGLYPLIDQFSAWVEKNDDMVVSIGKAVAGFAAVNLVMGPFIRFLGGLSTLLGLGGKLLGGFKFLLPLVKGLGPAVRFLVPAFSALIPLLTGPVGITAALGLAALALGKYIADVTGFTDKLTGEGEESQADRDKKGFRKDQLGRIERGLNPRNRSRWEFLRAREAELEAGVDKGDRFAGMLNDALGTSFDEGNKGELEVIRAEIAKLESGALRQARFEDDARRNEFVGPPLPVKLDVSVEDNRIIAKATSNGQTTQVYTGSMIPSY